MAPTTSLRKTITTSDLSDLLKKNGLNGWGDAPLQGALRGYPEGVSGHCDDRLGIVDIPARYSKGFFNSVRIAAFIIAHETREVYDIHIMKGPSHDIDYLRGSNTLYSLLTKESIPFTDERDPELLKQVMAYERDLSSAAKDLKEQLSVESLLHSK